MKKALLFAAALSVLPGAVMAEEKQPDPADLTATNTFLWGQAGNKDYTLTGGIAGNLSEDFSYLGLLEHTRTYDRNEDKNDNSRARLFGVQNVDWGFISKIGASVDYIKTHQDTGLDTTAVGLIAKVETGHDWLALFPNLAYVELSPVGLPSSVEKEKGYQANLFASVYLDEFGKYMMIQPQYTKTDHVEVKKLEISYGQPLSESGKWWGDIKLGYTKTEISFAGHSVSDDDKQIKAGVAYYF